MPMIYDLSLATPGTLTTNATPNTETETFFFKAGTRNAWFQSMTVGGRGGGLTAITGLVFRLIRWGTASTAGTTITPTPADPGMQAAKMTAASRPTSGTTRLNKVIFTCGAAGPGGFVAPNPDSVGLLEGSGAQSISCMDAAGLASMAFEWSAQAGE